MMTVSGMQLARVSHKFRAGDGGIVCSLYRVDSGKTWIVDKAQTSNAKMGMIDVDHVIWAVGDTPKLWILG